MNNLEFVNTQSTLLVNVREAARQLGVQVPTLYSWVSQRKMAFVKAGRCLRFDQRDINSFIDSQKINPVTLQ